MTSQTMGNFSKKIPEAELLSAGFSKTDLKTGLLDWVRTFFPTATDEQADNLLWSGTCFPFSIIDTRKQLIGLSEKHPCPTGDFEPVLSIIAHEAEEEMDKAMEQGRKDEARKQTEGIDGEGV